MNHSQSDDRSNSGAGSAGRGSGENRGSARRATPRRDNSSFGERRGKRYDGGGRGNGPQRSDRGRPAARPDDRERRPQRVDEPALPDDVEADELEPDVRRDLRSLDKNNADIVARHLVTAMYLVDDDPQKALAHARAAKNRAGRIGVVRETAGVIAYRAREWAEALGELRAARRISGGPGLLALMADCERGLDRPERAIEVARSVEAEGLDREDLIELRIVEAGARVDMEQIDAALVTLQDTGLDATATGEEAARLDYAYAEVLLAAERREEALTWFRHAALADVEGTTDAADRVAGLGG